MTEPDWHLWRAFLAVLDHGSLSGAARALRQTQPTLGRQIATLESDLGTPLFTRSTDGLRPTEIAMELVPHGRAMAAAAAALMRTASGRDGELRGTIRLAASEIVGGVVLPPILARFRALHPRVDIALSLSNRVEDLLRGDADLAVRNVAPTQTALVSRKIGEAPVSFFTHRDYVAAHGLPASVADLGDHTLIGLDDHARRIRPILGIEAQFGFQCSSDLGLLAALRAGFGIGYCQTGIGLALPELVPVLPGFVLARVGIWVVMHEDLRAMRRLRALFDHLVAELTRYLEPEPMLAPGSPPR